MQPNKVGRSIKKSSNKIYIFVAPISLDIALPRHGNFVCLYVGLFTPQIVQDIVLTLPLRSLLRGQQMMDH